MPAAALLVAFAIQSFAASAADEPRQRGQRLFDGEAPLAARLVGHDIDLPTLASRCINCHETRDKAPALTDPSSEAAPATYATALDGAWLTTPQARRGGPASVFDVGSLCTMLRTGVDPASIVISTTMPRYAITDSQCADLWEYLKNR